ncbi:MAG: rod shape-determining protein MreC [Synergistaceae bacterium]|jgi:rod shape-determining protein MreC|nr:rod shape-determining protein MreC [Synergistaceae bacterium]
MVSKLNPILVNSLLAIFCGLMFLWFTHSFPGVSKIMIDDVGIALSYPEMPAFELRTLVQAAGNWVMERRSLQQRNRELELENLELRTALQQTGMAPPVSTVGLVGARVTLRYPDAWWKEVRVNRGSSHGVVVGAPVLSDGFMIGRVARVGEDFSWVELVTSSTFLLAAVVNDTWDLGVINGDDMGNVWLMFMPPDKEFKRGMMVSTALVGDYLPPGIPIGMIWGAGELRDGFLPHRVASGAHLTQLYNVQILSSGADSASSGASF